MEENMKKYIIIVFCVLLMLIGCTQQKISEQQKTITIVTSFYPIYVLAKNITDGVEGITLQNMAQPQTGCLHDYQITTKDRKALEKADLLLVNGAGIESFLEGIKEQYQNLPVVDTSMGITLIEMQQHHHHNDEQIQHDEKEYNGHIWLYSENALKQAENICNALCEKDSTHKQQYTKNLELFRQNIKEFQQNQQHYFDNNKAVIFHEGFDYIAKEYGFTVQEQIFVEEEKTPSAKELAEMIEHIKQENVTIFFTADDKGKSYAELLAKEVEGKVYLLNPITAGALEKDAYLQAMKQNESIIQEALK
jgi:zinc transport system substrate-binding protein